MIPGHADLELSQLYKAAGGPQDHWPQMVWELEYGYRRFQDIWVLRYIEGDGLRSCYEGIVVPYVAAPVLISGDPEHPGVFEWLEAQGWIYGRELNAGWFMLPSQTRMGGAYTYAATPHALALAVLKSEREGYHVMCMVP